MSDANENENANENANANANENANTQHQSFLSNPPFRIQRTPFRIQLKIGDGGQSTFGTRNLKTKWI